MTGRSGRTVIIEKEPPLKCSQCGAISETRPYGRGGTRICFTCAMKDIEGTERRMGEMMFGVGREQ